MVAEVAGEPRDSGAWAGKAAGRQRLFEGRRARQRIADRTEVARTTAAQRQARGRALDVGTALEDRAHLGAQAGLVVEELHDVEALVDRLGVGERGGEALCKEACTGARQGAIDHAEHTCAPTAREVLHQLEVAPGRGVDDHQRTLGDARRRAEARQAALLRLLDVVDKRAQRRHLGAAEAAEGIERGDPIDLAHAAGAVAAIEAVGGSGVTADSHSFSMPPGSWSPSRDSEIRISPGARRATSAPMPSAATAMTSISPVEMSIQASASSPPTRAMAAR